MQITHQLKGRVGVKFSSQFNEWFKFGSKDVLHMYHRPEHKLEPQSTEPTCWLALEARWIGIITWQLENIFQIFKTLVCNV